MNFAVTKNDKTTGCSISLLRFSWDDVCEMDLNIRSAKGQKASELAYINNGQKLRITNRKYGLITVTRPEIV